MLPHPLQTRVTDVNVPERMNAIAVIIFERARLFIPLFIPDTSPSEDKFRELDTVRPVADVRPKIPEQPFQQDPVPDSIFETNQNAGVLFIPPTHGDMPALNFELQ